MFVTTTLAACSHVGFAAAYLSDECQLVPDRRLLTHSRELQLHHTICHLILLLRGFGTNCHRSAFAMRFCRVLEAQLFVQGIEAAALALNDPAVKHWMLSYVLGLSYSHEE